VRVLDRPQGREPALPRGLRDLVTGLPVFADRAGTTFLARSGNAMGFITWTHFDKLKRMLRI
jgi:hypothetical protein